MSLESWKSSLREIPDLISGEPSRENALLLAALYTLESCFPAQNKVGCLTAENPAQDENGGAVGNYANDELSDAERYLKLWRETKDDELKTIAQDELRHAEYWIRKAREGKLVPETELQDAITWHNALLAKM